MNFSKQEILRAKADGTNEKSELFLLNEHNLQININGKKWTSLVCTNTNLTELVTGHLLSSGLIKNKEEIRRLQFSESQDKADIYIQEEKKDPLKRLNSPVCEGKWIFSLISEFSKESTIHKYTSGSHSCILARQGKALFVAEDIGRHCALDKAIGYMILNDIPREGSMIFTSGRVALDMVEKVIRAGIGILISKSVPTIQALALAKEYGLKIFFRAWPDSFDYIE